MAFMILVALFASVLVIWFINNKNHSQSPSPEESAKMFEANIILDDSLKAGLPDQTTNFNSISSNPPIMTTPITGSLILSTTLRGVNNPVGGDYEIDLFNSVKQSKLAYNQFRKSIDNGWLVSVDDVNKPHVGFYIFNNDLDNQYLSGYREIPRSIKSINFDTGLETAYPSVEESEMHTFSYSLESKMLAFNAWKRYSNEFLFSSIDNWKVVVLDTENNTTFNIDNAHNPLWLPGGESLVYMRDNGIYTYNIRTKEEKPLYILPGDRQFYVATSATISPAKDKLLLMLDGNIILYDLIYSEGISVPELKESGRFGSAGVQYFWPLFSPDGQYYAVQAIDVHSDGYRDEPRIEIRHISSTVPVSSFQTGDFIFESSILNQWVSF